jgi:hypothetical protein
MPDWQLDKGVQKHMHEIRVGHDQAKCYIKNSSIPAAQLAKHLNIVFKCVRLALSIVSSNAKWIQSHMEASNVLECTQTVPFEHQRRRIWRKP